VSGAVRLERRADGVVVLRLDNPAHRNALNDAMIAALTASLRALAEDTSCRVVLLRGAGGVFCAGREITELKRLQQSMPEEITAAYDRLRVLSEALYYCPKPTVAVLERHALGAGTALASWSDIAIAEARCLLGYPEVRIGLPPTMTTLALIRGVPRKAAVDLLLTARSIDAAEAARLGLVTRAVTAEALEEDVERTLASLVANSPDAMARTKQMIWKTEDADHRSGLTVAVDGIGIAVGTREAREGVAAFLEKRKPSW
jgi:enoyl-CoA hydratase/carnithine racemase